MSDQTADQVDAAERVAREVRRAIRDGGAEGQQRVERLTQDWPDLANALSKLMHEHGVTRPESWKGSPPPAPGSRAHGFS